MQLLFRPYFSKPILNALIDLSTDLTKFSQFIFFRNLEGGWIFKIPMGMLTLRKKNGWAILLCMSTNGEQLGKMHLAQVFLDAF